MVNPLARPSPTTTRRYIYYAVFGIICIALVIVPHLAPDPPLQGQLIRHWCYEQTSRQPVVCTYPQGSVEVSDADLIKIGSEVGMKTERVIQLVSESRANVFPAFNGQKVVIFSRDYKYGGGNRLESVLSHIFPPYDEYNIMGIKLKEGDTAFDIGGNIGVTAILLMLKFPGIRLFTFEPVPESYFYLKWNATVAGVDTSLFNAYFGGLSSTGNDIFINWSPDDATAATSIDHDNRDGLPDGRVAVKTYKLDRVLQDHSLTGKQVAFVKLDCDGCERDLVPAYPSFVANMMSVYMYSNQSGTIKRSTRSTSEEFCHQIFCVVCNPGWTVEN